MGIIKKVKKLKSLRDNRVASTIATLMVVSSLGLMSVNTDKMTKVGTLDTEDVYVTNAVTYADFIAYTEMINYEIEQDGGRVTFKDVVLIDGKVNNKSLITKLNNKYSRREPFEIKDLSEKKKYKLSRDILMKKSENFPVDYLISISLD